MLLGFFSILREQRLPVTLRELMDLFEALQKNLVFADVEDFYYLSRTCLIKDEKYYDKFDRAFNAYFKELESLDDVINALIPDDWLQQAFLKQLSEEEKASVKSLGGLEKLIEEFKKRLEEQKKRHQGGSKWIGTGGTSPFGHGGYNPEGIRIGGKSEQRRAIKVWEKRQYKNLDDSVDLGTRNIKMALRRLRQFARTGAAEQLDLSDTIKSTAKNGGMLDIKMIPERHNAVKVLLLFDVGGSMDYYIRVCEEMFSAARNEFKHLEYYYFHNCVYEFLWQDNQRRYDESSATMDVLHKYGSDYKVIFIGDACMSPYEVGYVGGSVEHMNEEPGSVWLQRFVDTYDKVAWINPMQKQYWGGYPSTTMIKEIVDDHMYPLTLEGIEQAMSYLSR